MEELVGDPVVQMMGRETEGGGREGEREEGKREMS